MAVDFDPTAQDLTRWEDWAAIVEAEVRTVDFNPTATTW